MTEPTPANGYLVITAINSDTGEAGSETYQLSAVEASTATGDDYARYVAIDTEDGTEWVITQHAVGEILPEVEKYRGLVQGLIAADTRCPSPGCGVTTLGHLLASLTPEQVELVRELDPSQRGKP